MDNLRIGVSSCLLGQNVRYDGGHKKDLFLTDVLGQFVEFIPVCPEAEAGLGVPRPPMRLVKIQNQIRALKVKGDGDFTETLTAFSMKKSKSLGEMDLCGYIFKKDSPSCGVERV